MFYATLYPEIGSMQYNSCILQDSVLRYNVRLSKLGLFCEFQNTKLMVNVYSRLFEDHLCIDTASLNVIEDL